MILIEYWSAHDEDAPQLIAGPDWTEYVPAIGDTVLVVDVSYRVTAREWDLTEETEPFNLRVSITLSPIHEFE